MDIRIGVTHAPREVALESSQTRDEVMALVDAALSAGTPLHLLDSKGRTVVVPAERIAYVELDPTTERRVGFAS